MTPQQAVRNITVKLGFVSIAGFLLLSVTVSVILVHVHRQKGNALVINLAGRQRMLIQKMTKEALAVNESLEHVETLRETMELFDVTLQRLTHGEPRLGIPPTRDPAIRAQLDRVSRRWKPFKKRLEFLIRTLPEKNKALMYIKNNNLKLLEGMEEIVRLLEETGASRRHINLAGRQRMLSQKITKEAMLLNIGQGSRALLDRSAALFDRTHRGLLYGDRQLGLTPVADEHIRQMLVQLGTIWQTFSSNINTISKYSDSINQSLEYIISNNMRLLQEMDTAVRMLEQAASQQVAQLIRLLVGFLMIGLFITAGWWWAVRNMIAHPLRKTMEVSQQAAQGNLTNTVDISRRSEIGELAVALNQVISSIKDIMKDVQNLLGNIITGVTDIEQVSQRVEKGSAIQQDSFDQARLAVHEFDQSIREVSDHLDTLSQRMDEITSSILQMTGSIKQIDEGVENLWKAAEATATAIQEITSSIKQVAQAVTELSTHSEETSAAVTEIETSIQEIEKHAASNARLSQDVMQAGNEGLKAVQVTYEGMAQIKSTVSLISNVIRELQKYSLKIGNVITVIHELAEETNLIALNAAILAAQVGEQGKGFSVVASKIRELAEKTATSAREVEEIIESIQSQIHRAVESVQEAMARVQEGEKRAKDAITTFESILQKFEQSHEMSLLIARATQEQSRAAQEVTQTLYEETQTIHQIAQATQDQSQASRQVLHAVEKMNRWISEIRVAIHQQAEGSKIIEQNAEEVAKSAQEIRNFVYIQKDHFRKIVDVMERNREVMQQNQKDVTTLNAVVIRLKNGVDQLSEKMSHFKLE